MSRESHGWGPDRRRFLQTLAATGVLGATDAVGAATAQGDLDPYHETLRSDLTETHDLPAGEFVYGTTEGAVLQAFALDGQGEGTEVAIDVSTEDVPITRADRLTVGEDPTNDYDYTYLSFVEDRSYEPGDVLLAVAYLRSDTEGAEVQAGFKYRYTDPGGSTAYGQSYAADAAAIQPGGGWTRHYVPIEVGERPDGSEHTPYLEFWVGFGEQTIEVGGVALVDYSDADVAVGDVPAGAADGGGSNSLLEYEGRAEGAQWRQDARDRIAAIRTAPLQVTVVDGGEPVEGADVEVAMTEHAFDFGSAVAVEHLVGESEDDRRYRETFLADFERAVIENGLKVPAWEDVWNVDNDDVRAAVEWLNDNDVSTRGHYLVWEEYGDDNGGGMNVDEGLSDEDLQNEILAKIDERASEFRGQVSEWDAHNHPVWQSALRERLGWDATLEWWERADETTDVPLYTNEMGTVAGDFFREGYHDFVGRLLEDDAPIDGVGFMGHVQYTEGNVTPPGEVLSTFDSFAEHDLPLLITEFDVQIGSRENDEQVAWQADYLRDFLLAAYSHEAVEGVLSWGFWAGSHWRSTAAYYDEDWTLRPHGQRYHDLVYGEWWTEETGETDAGGAFSATGHHGTYEVTVTDGDRSATATVTLGEAGTTLELPLDGGTPVVESGTDGTRDEGTTTDADGAGLGVLSALAGVGGYALARNRDGSSRE